MYTVGIEIVPDRSLKQRSSFVLIKIIIKSIKSVAQRVSKTRKRPRKKFVSKKEDIKLQLRESKSQRPAINHLINSFCTEIQQRNEIYARVSPCKNPCLWVCDIHALRPKLYAHGNNLIVIHLLNIVEEFHSEIYYDDVTGIVTVTLVT